MLRPPSGLSRREMLRLSSGVFLSMGLWPGALSAADAPRSGNYSFIVTNDTHHMSDECTAWLERVVAQMRGHREARLCLALGDLTDTGSRESMTAFRKTFAKLGLPLHVQIGNHDYAAGNDRSQYEAAFPGRLNYEFRYRGWQYVSLDTTEGTKADKVQIQPATFAWLEENLRRLNPRRPTILFTHLPMAEGVQYRPLNADALLDQFRDFNLRAVFSGHYHSLTQRSGRNGAVMTTNRCCALKRGNHDGSKEKGYFLCVARNGDVTFEFIEVNPA
ncbi:MAG: metallophosphoesterase [Verrucomicrobia bacterium]|nr:metallophosphoesterase [Verrucomicrobiota bacterium]MBI3868479.1 metallophosphoesterase [Verrucomicrobiota bacterium]